MGFLFVRLDASNIEKHFGFHNVLTKRIQMLKRCVIKKQFIYLGHQSI